MAGELLGKTILGSPPVDARGNENRNRQSIELVGDE